MKSIFSVKRAVFFILIFIVAINFLIYLKKFFAKDEWPYLVPVPSSAEKSPALQRALQQWNQDQLKNAKDCAADFNDMRPEEMKITKNSDLPYVNKYEVIFDNPVIYSVAAETDFFCGGAHPIILNYAINWEVETGNIFDPLTLYTIGLRNVNGISVFPEIEGMIREELLQAAKLKQKNEECLDIIKNDIDNIGNIGSSALGLMSSGIYVAVQGYHVAADCYDKVVLKHENIKKYMQPNAAKRIKWVLN